MEASSPKNAGKITLFGISYKNIIKLAIIA